MDGCTDHSAGVHAERVTFPAFAYFLIGGESIVDSEIFVHV
jgi:hypothetical protein